MASLPQIIILGDGTGPRTWLNQSATNIDQPVSAASGSGVSPGITSNGTYDTSFTLQNTPSDFLNITSLFFQFRNSINTTDDSVVLSVRIISRTSGVVLAASNSGGAFQTVDSGPPGHIVSDRPVTVFGYYNTSADKAAWDDAEVEFRYVLSVSMSNDAAGVSVTGFDLSGTYESSGTLTVQNATHGNTVDGSIYLPIFGRTTPTNSSRTSAYNLTGRYWLFHELYASSGLLVNSYWRLARTNEDETGFEFLSANTQVSGNTIHFSSHDGALIGDDRVIIATNRRSDPDTNGNLQARTFAHTADATTVSTGSQTNIITDRSTAGTNMQNRPRVSRLTDSKTVLGTLGMNAAVTDWCVRLAVAQHGATGTTITPGTTVDVASPSGVITGFELVGVSDTEFVLVGWNATNVYAQRLTVSATTGTVITAGTWSTAINPSLLASQSIRAEKIDDDRVLVSYYDSATGLMPGSTLYAQVLDITSGSVVAGTATVIDSGWTVAGSSGTIFSLHAQPSDNGVIGTTVSPGANGPGYWSVSQAGTTNTALSITKPSVFTETAYGYFAMIAVDGDDGTITVTPDQAGWTEIPEARVVNTGNIGIRVFRRDKTDADPVSFTFTLSSNPNAGARGVIVAVFGATFEFIDDNPLSIVTATGSDNTADIGAITANRAADPMLIAVSAVGSSVTHTPPSGYTERADGATGTMALSVATIAAANNPEASFNLSGSAPWATVHFSASNGTGGPWYHILDISGTTITPQKIRIKPSAENGGPLDGEALTGQLVPSDTSPETYFGLLGGSTWTWVDLEDHENPTLVVADVHHSNISDGTLTTWLEAPIEATSGEDSGPYMVPFDIVPNKYLAIWSKDTNVSSGARRFRLFTSSEDDTLLSATGDIVNGSSGGLGIAFTPTGAWRMSPTQVAYLHKRGPSSVIGTVYTGVAAYNSGTDAITTAGFGSNTLQPVGVATGGTATASGDRMTDSKAIFVASQNTDASTFKVRAKVGTLADGASTSFSIGAVLDLINPSTNAIVNELRVVGLSDTRAVILAVHGDGGATSKVYGQLVSCTAGVGTTLTAIGTWVALNDGWLPTPGGTTISAIKLDGNRFLLTYAESTSNVATDRFLKCRIIDTTGDTLTAGNALTLETDSTPTVTGWGTQHHDVVLGDNKVFTTGRRIGSVSPTFQSIASNTVVAGNTMSITKPASTVDDELLWAFFAIDADDGSVVITAPPGWTEHVDAVNSGNIGIRSYYKQALSEGASYDWGFSTNVTAVGSIVRVSGATTDISVPWTAANIGSSANPALAYNISSDTMIAVSATDTDVAHAPPTGYTERLDLGAGSAIRLSIATDTNIGTGGSALPFTASSTNWATLHVPSPSWNSAMTGYVIDVGSSGTTAIISVDTTVMLPYGARADEPSPRPSYLTTTPNRITFGSSPFVPGAGSGPYDIQGFGFIDTPTEEILDPTLIPVGTYNGHTSDNITLAQIHVLVGLSDLSHGHSSDNVVLAQSSPPLIPTDTFHGHSVDTTTLTQTHVLAGLSDARHADSVDTAILTQVHVLASLSDARHSDTVDTVILSQTHSLSGISDARHGDTSDNVSLTQVHTLAGLSDARHGDISDNVVLTQGHTLAGVSDSFHAHAVDSAVLSQTHVLTPSDTTHGHSAEHAVLSLNLATQTVVGTFDGSEISDGTDVEIRVFATADDGTTVQIESIGWTALWLVGEDVDLVVNDVAHAHTSETIALTQVHTLAGQADPAHGHTVESVVLTQQQILVVADSFHASSSDSAVLTQAHNLTVTDARHTHSVDSVTLTQTHVLTTVDARHGHTVDSVALVVNLAVADARHAHNADNVVLTQVHSLVAQDAAHGHFVESVTLTQQQILVVADSFHSHAVETVALTQVHTLTAVDARHANSVDAVVLTQQHSLSANDVHHAHSVESVALVVNLVANDAFHGHTVDTVALSQLHILSAVDVTHSHAVESVLLVQTHILSAADSRHGHTTENVVLTQGHVLGGLNDAFHGHTVDPVTLAQLHLLTASDTAHGHTVDATALTQTHVLVAVDARHGHTVDSVALVQQHALAASDLAHSHTVDAVTITQVHLLPAVDARHAHSVDSVAITQAHSIVGVADTAHSHASENVVLTQGHVLVGLADAYHVHSVNPANLTQVHILTASDVAHGHDVETVALTQSHNIPVADAEHLHTVDTVALVVDLAVADARHGHSVDSVSITQTHSLVAVDTNHTHTVESVALVVDLAINDPLHEHSVDALVLFQNQNLVVNSVDHSHAVGSVNLTAEGDLEVDEAFHAHAVEHVTITQTHSLVANDASHTHEAETVALTQDHSLVASDSLHGHAVESVSLTSIQNLVVADSAHSHSVEPVVPTQVHALVVSDAHHDHFVDAVSLTQSHALAGISDLEHHHTVESPATTTSTILTVNDAFHGHTVDATVIAQQHSLVGGADASHSHAVESVALTQQHALVAADSAHSHSAETVVLTSNQTLSVTDSLHSHTVDSVTLAQQHSLAISDVSHNHSVESVSIVISSLTVTAADSVVEHTVDGLTIEQLHVLQVAESIIEHAVEQVVLEAIYLLQVEDAILHHTVDSVLLEYFPDVGTSVNVVVTTEVGERLIVHAVQERMMTTTFAVDRSMGVMSMDGLTILEDE